MAILYSDYKKKYGDIINVRRESQKAYKKSQQTSKDAKKEYEKTKSARKNAENRLINTYENKGVYVKNSGILPTPDAVRADAPKFESVEARSTSPGLTDPNNRYKKIENEKKFNEVNQNRNIQAQRSNLEDMYFQEGEAYYNYLNKKLEEDDIGWYDKTIGRVVAPIISPFTSRKYLMRNENGDTYSMPTYEDLKQQKVLDSYDDGFWGTVGKIGSSALYETGKLATSAALNTLIPGTGTASYFGNIYFNQWNNAVAEGYSKEQALSYATLSTATEAVTSKVLGGTTNAIFGTGTSELSQSIGKGLSNIIKNNPKLVNVVSNAISEGGEEFIQEYADVLTRNLTLNEDNKLLTQENFENAMFSSLVGMLTGGVTSVASSNVNNNQEKNQINQNVNLPNANSYSLPTYNQNIENTVVNDAVNSRVNQNNINLSKINQGQTQNAINSNSTNNQNSITSKIKKISKWALDKVGNLKPFKQQLIEYETKQLPSGTQLVVSDNSKGLAYANFSDNPIVINQTNVEKIINGKHSNIPRNIIENIDTELNNSVFAMDSRTVDNAKIVVLDAVDTDGNPIIASLTQDKKSGKIVVNELTSVYEKRDFQNYINRTIEDGKNIYTNEKTEQWLPRRGLQLPTRFTTDSVSYNNNSTNTVQSQIAPLPLNNMHNNQSNILNPLEISQLTQEDTNTTPILPNLNRNRVNDGESKNTKVPNRQDIKRNESAKKIANSINEIIKSNSIKAQQRSWVETSTESEVLKGKVLINDLDVDKINYVPVSNKSTLNKANNKLNVMGYDKAVEYIKTKINDSSISLEDIVLAERLIQESAKKGDTNLTGELLTDVAILGTELGQKTQALSIIQRLTPEGQLAMLTKIVQRAKTKGEKSFNDVEITPEMVNLILDAYNKDGSYDQNDLNQRVEQFKQKVADQLLTSTSEKISAWRYLSMLGNPKTHLRNIVSNVAMMYTSKVKNAMARTMEMALPVESRTKTWKKASSEVETFAKQTTIEMKNVIMGENKYSEKGSIESKKQIFKSKALEKLSDLNSNALSGEDWFFSKRAFENTLKEYLTAQNIRTQSDIENNPKIIEKAKSYALEQAEIATFRQYSWIAKKIGEIERKNSLSRLVIGSALPFKKTPINVARAGVKYSPIGLFKSITYDAFQLKNGNIEASQFIDNLAQGLTGTSLTLIGYALAKSGFLIGAGEDDKEGKYDYYLGNQSYALKIGGKTYSISWLSPVAMPLLVGANAYEKLEEGEDWDMNIIVDTLAQTLDPLSEMSFVSSLTDVLQSYQTGSAQMISEMGQNIIQNYITQFFPTVFSQLASTLDDTKRTTSASKNSPWKFGEETIRKIMYKIPGLRNQLEASTDIWGNEVKQSENIIERAIENFIAPWSSKKDITTDLDIEIKRIYNETGEVGVIPSIPQGYVKYKDETYYMSSDEYSNYKKDYGQYANKYLNELIKNSSYKNADDELKVSMIEQIYDYARTNANKEYFRKQDIDYTSNVLDELEKFEELNFNSSQIAEFTSINKLASSIRQSEDMDSSNKKKEISMLMLEANLKDEQLSYLYSKYYSSEEKLNDIITLRIPIKEYIKLDSQEFTTDYKNGKAVTNSKKNKLINYVNSLNLSIPQKAYLIKSQYSSYDDYNEEIINYINNQNLTKYDKAVMLKNIGFDDYNEYIVNEINSRNISTKEKIEILENLGFRIIDGKVYW